MKLKSIVAAAVLFSLLISGCATMGHSGEEEAGAVIALAGSGDTALLKDKTRLPFLLDSEILLGENELNLLWEGLAEAGFRFTDPVIEEIFPAAPEHYSLFGTTMDVEVFFRKYLKPGDSIVRFVSNEGSYTMLISSRKTGGRIAALGGM